MRPIELLTRGHKDRTIFAAGPNDSWDLPPFWTNEVARDAEEIDSHFEGYVAGAYKANGIVFACILVRQMIFSEARFQFQRIIDGRPADLFAAPGLDLLERPWPNGTTGELLAHMEQDASLAGNSYTTIISDKFGRRLRRLRPDFVSIITGSPTRPDGEDGGPWDLGARIVGYMYHPTIGNNRPDPVLLLPSQVAHYSPIPDPECQWRGMSWLTPVVREIKGDSAATKHKLKYFEHGTVGGVVLTYDPAVKKETVERFAEMWKAQHSGIDNAYKTFHVGGGATPTTLGADLKQLDFKVTQGAGETRIAAASGLGAVMAQFSEGMAGSALNAGNFSAARRRCADGLFRPLWRTAAASLESIVPPPTSSRLWYDARDVSFLQEDEGDAADIQAKNAETIARLTDAGFRADEVVRAVTAGDLRSLVGAHSGMFSVQLQPAGSSPASAPQGVTDGP